MEVVRLSTLSREDVRFQVYADQNGTPYDPIAAGDTVEAAFLGGDGYESGANPETADWKAAAWSVTVTGNYVAACEVGPGGTVALDAGTYACWLRITQTSGERVVRQVGTLVVA
jgi:hypothetical protein